MPKAKKRAAPKKVPTPKPMPRIQAMPRAVKKSEAKVGKGLAIAGLIINVLLLPGLGSVLAGRTRTGLWQLLVFVIGLVLSLTFVWLGLVLGGILIAIAWVWGLVTGIQVVMKTCC